MSKTYSIKKLERTRRGDNFRGPVRFVSKGKSRYHPNTWSEKEWIKIRRRYGSGEYVIVEMGGGKFRSVERKII